MVEFEVCTPASVGVVSDGPWPARFGTRPVGHPVHIKFQVGV